MWHFPRTDLAERVIAGFVDNDTFLINARRRMGKTSFLLEDILPRVNAIKGWRAIYVDFWEGDSSPERRLVHALEQHLDHKMGDFLPGQVKRLKILTAFEAETYETKTSPGEVDPYLALDDMIEDLVRQEKKIVFLLDEFQEVAKHRKGQAFLEQFRGSLNKRRRSVSAIFTGSSTDGLRSIFDDRKGPFYNFATPLDFPAFGEDFVDHCIKAFAKSSGRSLDRDEALAAFEALDRITQNFRQYLKSMLYQPELSSEDALRRARHDFAEDYRFMDTWIALKPSDRALLALLSQGEDQPYSQATRDTIAKLAHLAKVPTRSAVQSALGRMARRNLVDHHKDEGWRFMDPEFQRWISTHAETDNA